MTSMSAIQTFLIKTLDLNMYYIIYFWGDFTLCTDETIDFELALFRIMT